MYDVSQLYNTKPWRACTHRRQRRRPSGGRRRRRRLVLVVARLHQYQVGHQRIARSGHNASVEEPVACPGRPLPAGVRHPQQGEGQRHGQEQHEGKVPGLGRLCPQEAALRQRSGAHDPMHDITQVAQDVLAFPPLVHVQAAHGPVGVCEGLGVVRDKLLTSHGAGLGAALGRKGHRPHVATEGQVKDEAHIPEVALWARAVLGLQVEVGVGPPPLPWLRRRAPDRVPSQVRGLSAVGEEPGGDALVGIPVHGERAAALRIEGRTRGALRALLAAALVRPLALRFDVAVAGGVVRGTRLPLAREILASDNAGLIASLVSVQGRGDPRGFVHALDDVDLAPDRPLLRRVAADHPKGRPGTAACRHVVQSDDKEP
mmetsp:Transcript_92922/g.240008  ORF Transcript_92922/g.240008 Transcript_92922/m.240008 type:complete len:373 (-) Transcript_92922:395-1513(-)